MVSDDKYKKISHRQTADRQTADSRQTERQTDRQQTDCTTDGEMDKAVAIEEIAYLPKIVEEKNRDENATS